MPSVCKVVIKAKCDYFEESYVLGYFTFLHLLIVLMPTAYNLQCKYSTIKWAGVSKCLIIFTLET